MTNSRILPPALFMAAILLQGAVAQAKISDQLVRVKVSGGIELSGKLSVPAGDVRVALVILPGSGNTGSDGDISSPVIGFGYKGAPAPLSDQIAAVLSEQNGVATLRYAKRGYEDRAQLANQTMPFLITDAKDALAFVRERFPNAKTGFIGFSEGAQVALNVAAELSTDALFLISPPTRSIDDSFAYQFAEWPVNLIAALDRNSDGNVTGEELGAWGVDGKLPLLGPALAGVSWRDVDADHDGKLSITNELIPAYQAQHRLVMQVMQSPGYAPWYNSMKALPAFSTLAEKIQAPVYLYQSLKDAQLNWSWAVSDQRLLAGKSELRLFSELGHCFAPMDGALGEVKTSGPFAPKLLEQLAADVSKTFN